MKWDWNWKSAIVSFIGGIAATFIAAVSPILNYLNNLTFYAVLDIILKLMIIDLFRQ